MVVTGKTSFFEQWDFWPFLSFHNICTFYANSQNVLKDFIAIINQCICKFKSLKTRIYQKVATHFVNVLGKDLFMLFPLKLLCTSLQSLITKQAPDVLNTNYWELKLNWHCIKIGFKLKGNWNSNWNFDIPIWRRI